MRERFWKDSQGTREEAGEVTVSQLGGQIGTQLGLFINCKIIHINIIRYLLLVMFYISNSIIIITFKYEMLIK